MLVLDEPEQRLHAARRVYVSKVLRARSQAGVTVIATCHDAAMIEAIADSVVDLDAS